MEKLWDFILKKLHWILLFVWEVVALVFLFNGNLYHRLLNTTRTNTVVAHIYRVSQDVRSYFQLRQTNEELLRQNALLENQYLSLKRAFDFALADTVSPLTMLPDSLIAPSTFKFCTACVIGNSLRNDDNVITIDKGRRDGVVPNCGVISAQGVVGVVASASDRYATVIPLVNNRFSLSCKVLGSSYFGDLSWQGDVEKSVYLTNMPRHASYRVGDTVVTSGYSAIFPPNMMVGTIGDRKTKRGTLLKNRIKIPILLSTPFEKLDYVYVILQSDYVPRPEHLPQDSLQRNS